MLWPVKVWKITRLAVDYQVILTGATERLHYCGRSNFTVTFYLYFHFAALTSHCGGGEQFIVAAKDAGYDWASVVQSCRSFVPGWSPVQYIRQTTVSGGVSTNDYSVDCLERNLFSKLDSVFSETNLLYFWTGLCNNPTECTYLKREQGGVIDSLGTKDDQGLYNKFLLCEVGKLYIWYVL